MRTLVRIGLLAGALVLGAAQLSITPTQAANRRLYVPIAPRAHQMIPSGAVCPSTGQSYDNIPTDGRYSGAPPASSPDLNLSVRGYAQTTGAALSLVDYNGGTDPAAPQLASMFADNRVPLFSAAYRVYDWNWATNTKGGLLSTWPVTLLGMRTTVGEPLRLPTRSGSDIYQGTYYALVIYADSSRISLHYARNDYIAPGYGIHVENVCVDPELLAKYEQASAAGRVSLPALKANQPFGTAMGTEIQVAIRDTGTFMDPRARKDWWTGRSYGGAAAQEVSPLTHTTGATRAYTPPGVVIGAAP